MKDLTELQNLPRNTAYEDEPILCSYTCKATVD